MGFSLTSTRVSTEAFPPLPPTAQAKNGARSPYVQQVICELINNGTLHPGAYLPTEHELAEHWVVSRQTVHRALARLQKVGVLTPKPGIGWRPTVSMVAIPGTARESWCAMFEITDGPQSLRVAVSGLANMDAATEFGMASAENAGVAFLFCAPTIDTATFHSLYGKEPPCPDDTSTIPSCTPTTS